VYPADAPPSGLPRCGPRTVVVQEKTMPSDELEIHQIVLRMLREGYAALSLAQRRVIESMMAIC
jgi:hypothetical protein